MGHCSNAHRPGLDRAHYKGIYQALTSVAPLVVLQNKRSPDQSVNWLNSSSCATAPWVIGSWCADRAASTSPHSRSGWILSTPTAGLPVRPTPLCGCCVTLEPTQLAKSCRKNTWVMHSTSYGICDHPGKGWRRLTPQLAVSDTKIDAF